jgi:hypothetical protein
LKRALAGLDIQMCKNDDDEIEDEVEDKEDGDLTMA